jgi:hypothetical protein
VQIFATTREPIARLLSGLNWHFEVSHRGIESLLAHSVAEQLHIAEVQATDFSRLYSIMALVLKPDSGFLNCQARYILGADFASISDSEITRRLNSYCYIATEQTLPDLYQAFGFAEIPRDANEFRENAASKYHFDITIFKRPNFAHFSPITIATISPFPIWFGKRPGLRKGAVPSGRPLISPRRRTMTNKLTSTQIPTWPPPYGPTSFDPAVIISTLSATQKDDENSHPRLFLGIAANGGFSHEAKGWSDSAGSGDLC